MPKTTQKPPGPSRARVESGAPAIEFPDVNKAIKTALSEIQSDEIATKIIEKVCKVVADLMEGFQ